jgi:hypothetical protein
MDRRLFECAHRLPVLVHVRPDIERLHISEHDETLLQDAGSCKFAQTDL